MKGPKTKRPDAPGIQEAVGKAARRLSGPKDLPYVERLLTNLVSENALPIELLDQIPVPAEEAGKTRFDQLYDAIMSIAFPRYRRATLRRLLGPGAVLRPETRIWRIILPEKFNISHVTIRADSFQQAFGLGCDYACRMGLRIHGKIPADLTIRVVFVSEKAIRRMLGLRWANRVQKRKTLQLVGREFTPKEITGARLAALGSRNDPLYSIAKYAEAKDLKKILASKAHMRLSEVETESFRRPKGVPDEDSKRFAPRRPEVEDHSKKRRSQAEGDQGSD